MFIDYKKVFLLLAVIDGDSFVYGMSSSLTPPVVGHKPIASGVKIDNLDPVFGDRLFMSYQYSDADNDMESVPLITWYYNGKEVKSQTQDSYQPVFDPVTGIGVECEDVSIKVDVTPRSQSGDLKLGINRVLAKLR